MTVPLSRSSFVCYSCIISSKLAIIYFIFKSDLIPYNKVIKKCVRLL